MRILAGALCALLLAACATNGEAPSTMASRLSAMRASGVEITDGQEHGSGVLLSPTIILTADHVVRHSSTFDVNLSDGTTVTGKPLVRWGAIDVALMSIDPPAKIRPATLACRGAVLGEAVFAVGAPLELRNAVLMGNVASTEAPDVGDGAPYIGLTLAAAPGLSGGAVYGADGRIIGMVDAILLAHLGEIQGEPLRSVSGIAVMVPSTAFCKDVLAALHT